MDNLNNIPNAGNWGDAASKLNDNFNKVKQAVTTVENTSKNNKGYFTSLSALNTAFPSPKAGQTAYVYDEASSTNYYIYNAANGTWASSTVEAPSVGVDIAEYTKTGGSTKTTKDIDDIKANHGYPSAPKTLKEVDDDLAQLADEFKQSIAFTDGIVLNSEDGTTNTNSSYSTSDYIFTKGGELFYYTGNSSNPVYAKYAFYDAEKIFISAYSTIGAVSNLEVEIPESVSFVRFCGHVVNQEVGHVAAYVSLNKDSLLREIEIERLLDNVIDEVDDVLSQLADEFKQSIAFTDGIVLNSEDGTTDSNSRYSTSDYVPTKGGELFYYTGNTANPVYAKYAFYDAEKIFISADSALGAASNLEVEIPESASFVRFCGYVEDETVGHVAVYTFLNKDNLLREAKIERLFDNVTNTIGPIVDNNTINVTYLEELGLLNSSGSVVPNTGAYMYKVSDFIPVAPNFVIRYSGTTGTSTYGIWYYDANKGPISYAVGPSQTLLNEEFIVPSGTAYCRISGRGRPGDGLSAIILNNISAITSINEKINEKINEEVNKKISTWNGKTLAVIGDSVSAGHYAPAEIIVAAEDVGRPFNCYITGFDVANYVSEGTPAKNKSIYSCVIPAPMVGKLMECIVKTENIGDVIGGVTITTEMVGTVQSFTITEADIDKVLYGVKIIQSMEGIEFSFTASIDDVGLVLGEPRGYKPDNNNTTIWYNIIASELQMDLIGASNWSGSTYSRIVSAGANVCSYAWHPQTIRKIAGRDIITGNRVAPDCVLLFRGINDWAKEDRFDLITGWNPLTEGYPVDDFVDGSAPPYDFKKAVTKTIEMIRNEYPLTRIFICTLYHNKYRGTVIEGDPENEDMQPFPPTNYTHTIMEYNNSIREVADALGVGLIELDKCGITYENLLTYAPDGVHANNAGHALMATRAIRDMSE